MFKFRVISFLINAFFKKISFVFDITIGLSVGALSSGRAYLLTSLYVSSRMGLSAREWGVGGGRVSVGGLIYGILWY